MQPSPPLLPPTASWHMLTASHGIFTIPSPLPAPALVIEVVYTWKRKREGERESGRASTKRGESSANNNGCGWSTTIQLNRIQQKSETPQRTITITIIIISSIHNGRRLAAALCTCSTVISKGIPICRVVK